MAVAGGNTWAYWLELAEDGTFKPTAPGSAQTRPWSLLPTVEEAVRRILAGEGLLVAGPDVFTVRAAVETELKLRKEEERGGNHAD